MNGNTESNTLKEWVKLNVGGTVFMTTKTTLSKDHIRTLSYADYVRMEMNWGQIRMKTVLF